MTSQRSIRYRTKPEHADENERLIRAVFAELAEKVPMACTTQRSASTTASASCTWPCSTAR